jgi:plastocyanin
MRLLTGIATGIGILATTVTLTAVAPGGILESGPAAGHPAGHQTFTSGAVQPVAAATVSISDFDFNPANTTVLAGSTVTWTNNDSARHDVVGGPLHSPTLSRGQSWSYTFSAPGTYSYICSIHPEMRGSVIVR